MLINFVRRLVLDVEREIPDFIADGELWTVTECLLTVSGVKLTCFAVFEIPSLLGVAGAEGSALSRLGLLALLESVAIEAGPAYGFFVLELGYRRIDLTRSNLIGLWKKLLGSVVWAPFRVFMVADFVKVLGVAFELGFDGDRDKVGICVGFLTLAVRAKEACVGVLIAERNFD